MDWFILGIGGGLRRLMINVFCFFISWYDPTCEVIALVRHVGNTIYVDSIVTGTDISEEQEG